MQELALEHPAGPTKMSSVVRRLSGTTGLIVLSALYAVALIALKWHLAVVLLAVLPFAALFLLGKPRYALYITIGVTVLSDEKLTPWLRIYRGVGELSNRLLDWVILSPLELLLILTLIGVALDASSSRHSIRPSASFHWPMLVFYLVFIPLGFAVGFMVRGDLHIGLFEARALAYLPITYFLFVRLIRTRQQLFRSVWFALGAIFLSNILMIWRYAFDLGGNTALRAIADHQTSVFSNVAILFAICCFFYRVPRRLYLLALISLPFSFFALIANNRRASFVGLVIGCLLLLVLAYRDNRAAVLRTLALLVLFGGLYAGAFWNSTSLIARPLNGIRSVQAEPGSDDYDSNYYRILEKWDIAATIRRTPIFGVGFGGRYDMPVQLVELRDPFHEYVTHNSVLWIWLKTGAFGFIVFLMFLGYSVSSATRIYHGIRDPVVKPWLAAGLVFIVMYTIYSYVDQGWDYKGTVFLGVVLGSFAAAKRILASDVAAEQGERTLPT